VSDDKNPIEAAVDQALDAFVYAPIGLVFDGPALFPKLVEKGRNQVQVARMMGKMAVQMGQSEAEKRLAATDGPLRDVFVVMGVVPPDEHAPPKPAPEPTVATTKGPTRSSAKRAPRPAKKAAKKATGQKPVTAAPASSLGIPDYDSLSASQVVKRLRGMDSADLAAVQAYEAATRSRKTILNRIAQLQKG
jgi:hypothetical protein